MLGPKTVARFWTLILLTFEWACTSSRNLQRRREATGEAANPEARPTVSSKLALLWPHPPDHTLPSPAHAYLT